MMLMMDGFVCSFLSFLNNTSNSLIMLIMSGLGHGYAYLFKRTQLIGLTRGRLGELIS